MKKHALAICWALVAVMTLAALVPLALSPGLFQTPLFRGSPPLTKGLVELHSGSLTLESEVGRGTTVRIALPKKRS